MRANATVVPVHHCLDDSLAVCDFRIAMGTYLTVVGVMGILLIGCVVFCIAKQISKLPGRQDLFLMSIMLNDVMLGVASLIWGLGVLDTRLCGVSETGELNGFCTQWPIFRENAVKKSFVTSSIPLTFDRFFSIVLPDQHPVWVTYDTSLIMMGLQWLPFLLLTCWDFASYNMGLLEIVYDERWHKCVTTDRRTMENLQVTMYIFIPIAILGTLYGIMIYNILKKGLKWAKQARTAMMISGSAVAFTIPSIFIHFHLVDGFSYEELIVFESLHYLGCVLNPVIYFATNPHIARKLWERIVEGTRNTARAALIQFPKGRARSKGNPNDEKTIYSVTQF